MGRPNGNAYPQTPRSVHDACGSKWVNPNAVYGALYARLSRSPDFVDRFLSAHITWISARMGHA